MNSFYKQSLLILSLLAYISGARGEELIGFQSAPCPDVEFVGMSAPCELHVDGDTFKFHTDGRGLASLRDGYVAFHIPVPADGLASGYRIAETEYGFVVVVDYSFPDSAAAAVTMLDASSLEVKWLTEIPVFNVLPTIREDHIYISGIGFVAKIDLKTGAFVWRHSELYDRETFAFGHFRDPVFASGMVIFEDASGRQTNPRKLIVVNDQTGEIEFDPESDNQPP